MLYDQGHIKFTDRSFAKVVLRFRISLRLEQYWPEFTGNGKEVLKPSVLRYLKC